MTENNVDNSQVAGKMIRGKRWDPTKGKSGSYVPAKFFYLLIYAKKDGKLIETGSFTTRKGQKIPNYQVERWLRLPETTALNVATDHASACLIFEDPPQKRR